MLSSCLNQGFLFSQIWPSPSPPAYLPKPGMGRSCQTPTPLTLPSTVFPWHCYCLLLLLSYSLWHLDQACYLHISMQLKTETLDEQPQRCCTLAENLTDCLGGTLFCSTPLCHPAPLTMTPAANVVHLPVSFSALDCKLLEDRGLSVSVYLRAICCRALSLLRVGWQIAARAESDFICNAEA